jgi:GntR family transcriptional regulator / MocR family aminotransferase
MEFHITFGGGAPLRVEIYQQIRGAILDGRLRAGDAVPPTRELAHRLKVSRNTVEVAYERLVAEGFLVSRVGAGTFVRDGIAAPAQRASRQTSGVIHPRPVWRRIALSAAFEHRVRFDFRTGLPDASHFPHQAWRRAVGRALRPEAALGGVYAHPAGYAGLREAIARHIGVSRGLQVTADDMVITSGAQQAIDVIARALLAPGDVVAMEDPGYQPARRLFRSLGARVVGVPVDREGIIVDAVPPGVRLLYVTPSHQYPLGVSMSLPRRRALLNWAERHGSAIIEDDYDTEFRFGGRPLEPLQRLDASGRVIYVGSFSKTMLPTLRLGFLVAPASLAEAVQRAKFVTDWHTPLLTQMALATFIEEGAFARHVRRMTGVYRERRALLTSTLERALAPELEIWPSTSGLHVAAVARRATNKQIDAWATRLGEAGIGVQRLSTFRIDRPAVPGFAFGYGAITLEGIAEGLRRVRACMR